MRGILCTNRHLHPTRLCMLPVGTRSFPSHPPTTFLPWRALCSWEIKPLYISSSNQSRCSLNLCCGIPKWANLCIVCSFPCFLLEQSPFVGIFCHGGVAKKEKLPSHSTRTKHCFLSAWNYFSWDGPTGTEAILPLPLSATLCGIYNEIALTIWIMMEQCNNWWNILG